MFSRGGIIIPSLLGMCSYIDKTNQNDVPHNQTKQFPIATPPRSFRARTRGLHNCICSNRLSHKLTDNTEQPEQPPHMRPSQHREQIAVACNPEFSTNLLDMAVKIILWQTISVANKGERQFKT